MADMILQKSFQNADLVIKKHSTNTENSFAAQIFFVETTFFSGFYDENKVIYTSII